MYDQLFMGLKEYCYKLFIHGVTHILEEDFDETKLRLYYRNTNKIMIYLRNNVKPDKSAKNLYLDLDFYRKQILTKLKPEIYDQLQLKPKGLEKRVGLQ